MGACLSKADDEAERERSKQIDRQLKTDSKDKGPLKLLLLGPGDSGKSTIFKQIQVIHREGFAEEERIASRKLIHRNILLNAQALINAVNQFNYEFDAGHAELAERIAGMPPWSSDVGEDCKALWSDSAVQKVYLRRAEFQLNDSTRYFMENIDRINDAAYVPSDDDMLRIRIPTTGVVETEWTYKNKRFQILDMGGQRCERRKWISHFDCVTAIIFVAALSDYNQVLFEDHTTNRMHESIQLFNTICTNELFQKTPIILFLNKVDLFREKIAVHDLKECFPEYQGGCDYDAALKYIEDKFCEASEKGSTDRTIYIRHTCATDKETMAFVFEATADIILQKTLEDLNLV